MNHSKFHYKKCVWFDEAGETYEWYLVNKEKSNGVHFHGFTRHDKERYFDHNRFGFATLGLEQHNNSPLYPDQKPVSNCWVTGGDCYCDGTSMGARELLGHIDPEGNDDGYIWCTLEWWYYQRFGGDDATTPTA